jgi:hypothetical protein
MRALVCLVVIGATALPALADEREEARREFALGQAADKQREWQEAIEHYLRANDLAPHPFAIFNIATDYERLGKLREAARWYQRYLDAAPDAVDRDKVARTLQDISLRPAPIVVRSTPPGGRVAIDAIPLGPSPYTGQVKGGFHRVSIELDGERQQKDITVEFGEPVDVAFTMRGPSGVLLVHGEPAGAFVTVDNTPAGRMPLELPVAAGKHTVQVAQQGYKPYETAVVVAARGQADVPVTLEQAGAIDGTGGRVIRAGYLFGGGGGADLRGSGTMAALELGLTGLGFDISARLGKASGLTSLEILFRWALVRGRLSPTLAAGYSNLIDNDPEADSAAAGGGGYEALGGLRFTVASGEHSAIMLGAETGIRYHAIGSDSQLIVPLFASVLVVYR